MSSARTADLAGLPLRDRERTLVVGLGNPLLGDDGVGWQVAQQVAAWLETEAATGRVRPVDVDFLAVGGLRLMERLVGYETAIAVDAATFLEARPGTVRTLALDDVPAGRAGHLDSAHDTTLMTALALGRRLGAELPRRITLVAVQAERPDTFSEGLSPAVVAAVQPATDAVIALLTDAA